MENGAFGGCGRIGSRAAWRLAAIVTAVSMALLCGLTLGMARSQDAYAAQGGDNSLAVETASSMTVQAKKADPRCVLIAKDGAYYNCTSKGVSVGTLWSSTDLPKVTTIFVAANAKKIPDCLFYQHSGLKTLTFLLDKNGKNACASIARAAYFGSTLKRVNNFEKTRVTTIGELAFSSTDITSIRLPKTLKKMGKNAFSGCEKLRMAKGLKKTKLTSIPDDAFTSCALTTASLPATCKKVSIGAFGSCAKLKSVALGSKVSSIGELAFDGCKSLKAIRFPKNLTSIRDMAFGDCKSLKSIDLPARVVKVNKAAFEGCTSLSKVTMRSTKVISTSQSKWSVLYADRVFGKTPIANAKSKSYIYVPKKVLAKYKAVKKTSGWYAHRAKFRAI